MSAPVVAVLVARVPAHGVDAFLAYEAAVLPLLAGHGGALERRLRRVEAGGDVVEVHVVRFASAAGFAAYRADPARQEQGALLAASEARVEVLELEEAPVADLLGPVPGTKP
jgi:antibiotic biosynthesis monooxygenase (ABM) superfamily enzyme